MRRLYVDGVELFSRGFAGKLHKRTDERLHGQPRNSKAAAGNVGATVDTQAAKASRKPTADANSPASRGRGRRPNDPAQATFKF